jgi:hypothetical protein
MQPGELHLASSRGNTMEVLPAALAAMARYRQFIVCLFVPNLARPGKTEKFPINWRTGEVANAHDSTIWLGYEEALAAAALLGEGHGAGFVFTAAAGFFFLDIDDCKQADGYWSPLAQHLMAAFPGAAVEISHSGRGLHIFGRGTIPPHACKNTPLHLELYHEGRFVALGRHVTGDSGADMTTSLEWLVTHYFPERVATQSGEWRTEPVPEWSGPADDDALLARARRSGSAAGVFGGRATFDDLWTCNSDALARAYPSSTGDDFDHSSADAALASHLAYWTGNHHERIERLMQRSALVRPKWDREGFLTGTITFSCGRQTRWLADKPPLGLPPAMPLTNGHAQGYHNGTAVGSFAAAAGGVIPPTLVNLQAALRSAEGGVKLGYDAFLDRITLGDQAFRDVDYVKLRTSFEERGFKSVPAELMRDAVRVVAHDNTYDSLADWARALVWDGVPRVETALCTYFGVAESPYARATSQYLFTALAGRALVPGCQADMALILVGDQGSRKTHGVKALAPTPEAFGNADLSKVVEDDAASARRLRGKSIIELGELRGLASKDDEAVKEWVSRRNEAWSPKYVEFESVYPRRCVLLGTSNRNDLLSDPTGNRRWLPVMTGYVDDAAIERDREQLWAEGVAGFLESGVIWSGAEQLAKTEHENFRQVDPWEQTVSDWLSESPPMAPGDAAPRPPRGASGVRMEEVARGALGMSATHLGRREELRIAKVLRALNYEKCVIRFNGRNTKTWRLS